MECKKVQSNFSVYYDKQLKSKKNIELEKHLSVCVDCQEKYKIFKENILLVKETLDYSAPDYLWYKIKNKIQQENQRTFSFGFFTFWRFAFVSIFIIFILGSALFVNYKSKKDNIIKNTELEYFLINSIEISNNEINNFQNIESNYDIFLDEDYNYFEEETIRKEVRENVNS